MILENYLITISKYDSLRGIFDVGALLSSISGLKKQSIDPKFWDNKNKASRILKKIVRVEKEVELWEKIENKKNDIEVLFEFFDEGEINIEEIYLEVKNFNNSIEDIELKTILGRDEDTQNAILTIHPGAGGTESQDWVQMLYRMYGRCQKKWI